MSDIINIHTDGICPNSPGPGGYALIIEADGKQHQMAGGNPNTTTMRMKMKALITAFRVGKWVTNYHKPEFVVYTDSKYLADELTWSILDLSTRRTAKHRSAHLDLWEELMEEIMSIADKVKVLHLPTDEIREDCRQMAEKQIIIAQTSESPFFNYPKPKDMIKETAKSQGTEEAQKKTWGGTYVARDMGIRPIEKTDNWMIGGQEIYRGAYGTTQEVLKFAKAILGNLEATETRDPQQAFTPGEEISKPPASLGRELRRIKGLEHVLTAALLNIHGDPLATMSIGDAARMGAVLKLLGQHLLDSSAHTARVLQIEKDEEVKFNLETGQVDLPFGNSLEE